MSHMSMILTGLMLMAMLVFIAPNIFALNRGHVLRNIALWLAIFLGLTLFYQNFGPGSAHPLFKVPEAMSGMNQNEALKLPAFKNSVPESKDKDDADKQETAPLKE
ncbi:MAG: hypothetical protein P4M13_03210 [Alphaproteobacteria bacterium]|nr:hypothetical protein [Alphaproteobacteria bacterium]